jgi:phosphate transport system protein
MLRHFDEELKELKGRLLVMAGMVEQTIAKAIEALKKRNKKLAEGVYILDKKIDHLEIEIEERCIDLIALRQPVGSDLRFLIGAIKINNDLERMGDHAVNIADSVMVLADKPHLKPLIDIPRMARLAIGMLKDSLNSFVEGAEAKARDVCKRDDQVDRLAAQVFRELLSFMIENPKTIPRATQLILVSRNLERIADLSTNICEDVIYINQAKVIKHHAEEQNKE